MLLSSALYKKRYRLTIYNPDLNIEIHILHIMYVVYNVQFIVQL